MSSISASVGRGGVNRAADVIITRGLLQRHARWIDRTRPLPETDTYTEALGNAIATFQTSAAALANPDGRVDPGGFTLQRLNLPVISGPQHRVFIPMCWYRPTSQNLNAVDFAAAAQTLNCEAAAIQAVAEVEVSTRGAWQSTDGRPTILFERHYFRNLTNRAYDRTHPDISGPPTLSGYGSYSSQYPKLYRAAMLNESAALKSASWEAFQIMGNNHVAAGHAFVGSFVTAMLENERRHLDAFVAFIQFNPMLLNAIRQKNWANFARAYNGPNYARNNYDIRMAQAYARLIAQQRPRSRPP